MARILVLTADEDDFHAWWSRRGPDFTGHDVHPVWYGTLARLDRLGVFDRLVVTARARVSDRYDVTRTAITTRVRGTVALSAVNP